MNSKAWLLRGPLVFVLSMACIGNAVAEQPILFSGLRQSVSVADAPLSSHIENRSRWVLRSENGDRIAAHSLAAGLRPSVNEDLGIDEFLASALNRSDALLSNLYHSNANHQAIDTAAFALLPTVSFILEHSWDSTRRSALKPNARLDGGTGSLKAEWMVFSSGANRAAIRAAQFRAEASDWQYLAAERQAFLKHSSVYLQAVTAQKLVAAVSNSISRLKQIRRSTKLQFEAGLTSKTDLAQIDAEIAAVGSQLERARAILDQQRIAYRDIVGLEPPKKFAVPSVGHLVPKSREEAMDRALQSNFAINAARANHKSVVEDSRVTLGNLLPRITLIATADTDDIYSFRGDDDDYYWEAGARLSIPLINPASNSRYREAREKALAASFYAIDTERKIRQTIESDWTAYQSLKQRKRLVGKRYDALKRSRSGVEKQVDVGLRPISDLLNEEIRLTHSEIERIYLQQEMNYSALQIAIQFSDLTLQDIAPTRTGS